MHFVLNGKTVAVDHLTPHTTLLDHLRAAGLTGAKEGCAEGECGACTVVLVRPHNTAARFVPVNSCLMLLGMAAGHEIYTVEALAPNGKLCAAQQAMVDHGASQCGYCTPGFVMSLFAEHYRPGRTGPCDPHAMSGNLCRCTGYRPIRDAALSLGPPPQDEFTSRLHHPAPHIGAFTQDTFARPASLPDLFTLLNQHPQAQLIAGGTDLVVENNLKAKRFHHIISLEALPELRLFRDTPEAVEIGAGLTLAEIGESWHTAPPVFAEWLHLFASPLIRNRATLGGSLVTASPIGDSAPLLLALNARVRLASQSAERTVPLRDFFIAYRKSALLPQEVMLSVIVPKPLPQFLKFYKVAKRRMDDISTVAAGFALNLDAHGRIAEARFAFGGVAPTPIRAARAEAMLKGRLWTEESVTAAQEAIAQTLHPVSDRRGSAAYRLAIAQSLVEKFWYETNPETAEVIA